MLQYSLVDTVADRYHDFGRIGAATMVMVARSNGLDLSLEDAQAAIAPIRSLPPHADVVPALQALKEAGFRMAALTNSPPAVAQAQLENAGIAGMFEQRLSVEGVLLYKPHSHVYRWAAHQMGVQMAESMLVAAHGWDIAGALWAGWRAAFLARPGAQLYPLAPTPEIVQPDLRQAAELLIALDR
jgi:2-haloacid dehalogenase